MTRKDRAEEEISALTQVLDSMGVGRHGPLVDREGFPRADLDLFKVREHRQRISVLQTDHKAIMREIEQGLTKLHSMPQPGVSAEEGATATTTSASGAPQPSAAGEHPGGKGVEGAEKGRKRGNQSREPANERPFAFVDSVAPDSPAAAAGLQVGDHVAAIGRVTVRHVRQHGLAAVA